MGLDTYKSEGWEIDTPENRVVMASTTAPMGACRDEKILEGRTLVCDSFHNLLADLGCMKGLILRKEGALDIQEGTIRDIATISRANRPVCFIVTRFQKGDVGNPIVVLLRGAVQEKCRREYIEKLRPGDVTDVRVIHPETFGASADIGCGIVSSLPIGAISASRTDHPRGWLTVGMDVRTIIRSVEGDRIISTQKGLPSTWEENAALFYTGETVVGIIRSTEPCGIFVELAPNLAGLAEIKEGVLPGQQTSVHIKSILPSYTKIRLAIIDTFDYSYRPIPLKCFFKGDHMDRSVYSPECSDKQIVMGFL